MRIPMLKDAVMALPLLSGAQQRLGDAGSVRPNEVSTQRLPELPGGAPFSHCDVSRSTDLFDIKSVALTKQPIYFEDDLFAHIRGTFQDTWTSDAIINMTVDCGSHCEMYGNPPGERPGESFSLPFCNMSDIDQPPRDRKGNQTCPPMKGPALISSPIYAWSMLLNVPGWYNFTFDARTSQGDRIYCLTAEVCLRWEDPEKNKHYPKGPWSDCRWPR